MSESMQKSGASIEKPRESIKKNRKWGKNNREKSGSIDKGAQAAPFPEAGQGFASMKRCLPESMQKSGASIKKLGASIKKNRKWGRINREKAESIDKSRASTEKHNRGPSLQPPYTKKLNLL
ncbi:hypothetical protein [Salibacterium lacus]|uniref:Uncharacterized protein n=1 Tax=Salibacterium lacus TaxID=1898109 RepID=A0ABW5T0V1_9BACI